MKDYLFECSALVSVLAETAVEARQKLIAALYEQNESVEYNSVKIYVPPVDGDAEDAALFGMNDAEDDLEEQA